MPAGNGLPTIDLAEVSEERMKYIEFANGAMQKTFAERDAAYAERDKHVQTIAAQQTELNALQALSAAQESRAIAYQIERDAAIARRIEVEVFLRTIYAQNRMLTDQMREFKIDNEPVIKTIEPAGG
jgi:hypothetical protein